MSDYLWDKTGEPDEDVERLENLLGALKYKERPLEIPANAAAIMSTRSRPAITTVFSRPRLAIAASLILMLLAGTWLVTRQGEPQPDRMAEVEQGNPADQRKQPETAVVPNTGTHDNASADKVELTKPRENKVAVVRAAAPGIHRTSRQTVATRQKRQPRRDDNPPTLRHEEVATVNPAPTGLQFDQTLTPQQREATEQLMFALRLASAKLNYAQREVQEIGRTGK